ncbi:hypothetical protein IQ251_04375 [Saccharopolyspora sp. HNM0983]|uniref:Uncharacterized protein n=1 Tax=Saccharopolyspora montiporae TaxID=2781240 RepID=A0A929B5Q8_9PSEU|nr:hypothetical protein [Saccharopolyspora sp. HNM0983]MBE9373682.1 hypothetical protein [Saccharopolyspora sp. HNM0983]
MRRTPLAPQDTYDLFLDPALRLPWFSVTELPQRPAADQPSWTVVLTEIDDGAATNRCSVTHEDVLRAVRVISRRRGKRLVSARTRERCRALMDRGRGAVDPRTADQVLQVAAFGEAPYGPRR